MTLILPATDSNIAAAAALLRNGGLVAFPTETVYGLGANALMPEAAAHIYDAKGRPSDNPLIVHIAQAGDAERYAYTCPLYYALSEKFMPGPLTVILPKRDCIPLSVTGGLPSVGLRVPFHPIARKLIAQAGVPVCAPSANTSGRPSPTRAEHVLHDLDGRIDMILDGGACEIGVESTIVKIDRVRPPDNGVRPPDNGNSAMLLRPGKITEEQLQTVLPTLKIDPTLLGSAAVRPLAPGMCYRHYAPTAELVLLDSDKQLTEIEQKKDPSEVVLHLGDTPEERMASLYEALRSADRPEVRRIYALRPNRESESALYNRMTKAAGG